MSKGSGRRGRARELVVQALYQQQITGHSRGELERQFRDRPEYERVDREYFDAALAGACDGQAGFDELIASHADRPVGQLDPVEHAVLLLALWELEARLDIPFKVVINEAVGLARRFGAADGHKFVNALLDRAAPGLRPAETRAK